MKRWGRFLTIFVAYGIALLHTAVPHHHAQPQVGGYILVHHGCFLPEGQSGLLQKVLSTDLGIGHLENFKKSAETPTEFSPRLAFLTSLPVAAVKVTAAFQLPDIFGSHIEKLCRHRLLLPVSSFRGPPVC